jgi:pyrroline-5-carboxylate reductase
LIGPGEEVDLPAGLAGRLEPVPVARSGELMRRSSLDPAQLRQNVTSPGGTTAAALDILMGPGGLDALMERAVAAATRRSRQLGG